MSDKTKISKEFLKDFNWGYQVAKELGLKPNDITGMSASKNRTQAIKDGVKQYQKEQAHKKNREEEGIKR
ncbi:hypothetical protein [Flavivirga eckloniae]|uniref:Small, acid-soluble spore protein, alpha/beta type n=1 Tax=Flavivirga eckloniae TaxID=1803846 RepID=A0A2K9PLV2_9FLAO|nr:hypothetical protein [Flavivirga eckloniae]AUP78005.1 hypothetical protein C1H87_04470 [Flavivirga eckloniae]